MAYALTGASYAAMADGLGLSVDTRAVTCHLLPTDRPPAMWTPFAVTWH